MPVVSVFFRGLACVPLPRNWSLILELLPRPEEVKIQYCFQCDPSVLLINIPSCFSTVRKEEGNKVWGEQQGPHQVRTSAGSERARASWVSPVFFPVKWFTCRGKSVCNVQTLLCLSWVSKWGGDFCFCFSHFACLSLETRLQCFPLRVEASPASFKCAQVKGLYQRNTGHFKCYSYSLSFLVFFIQVG